MITTSPLRPALALAQASMRSLSLASLAVVASLASHPAYSAGGDAVAQVSLLIGSARVSRLDGSSEVLQRGASIQIGDRIETGANGHVHLRFVDNGAASVRPDSVLEVQAYRYDPARPQASEVRLRIEHGTARSISGAATEIDKSRFRLNTPIAAIGVRGTDFIVQTDASGMRATVSDGAIVVGAFGANCSATGLGPCGGSEARLLTADMGRLMAEVHQADRVTRVVPAVGSILLSTSMGLDERSATRLAAEMASRAAALTSGQTPSVNDRAEADLLTLAKASLPDPTSQPIVTPPPVVIPQPGATPQLALNRQPDLSSQLIWGRWAISAAADDRLTVPFVLAQYGRELVLGSSDQAAGLYRVNPNNPGPLLPDSLNGKVELNLSRAAATFESAGRSEVASVAGRLSLDFARRSFATALAMSSATGGATELRMGGPIRTNGTFNVVDIDQRLGGAVSLDGKEAGYWFERDVVGGLFRGKTLWGR